MSSNTPGQPQGTPAAPGTRGNTTRKLLEEAARQKALDVLQRNWGTNGGWLPEEVHYIPRNAAEWPLAALLALAHLSTLTIGTCLHEVAKDYIRVVTKNNNRQWPKTEDIQTVINAMSAPDAIGFLNRNQHEEDEVRRIKERAFFNDWDTNFMSQSGNVQTETNQTQTAAVSATPRPSNAITNSASTNTSDVLVSHGVLNLGAGELPPAYPAHLPPELRPRQTTPDFILKSRAERAAIQAAVANLARSHMQAPQMPVTPERSSRQHSMMQTPEQTHMQSIATPASPMHSSPQLPSTSAGRQSVMLRSSPENMGAVFIDLTSPPPEVESDLSDVTTPTRAKRGRSPGSTASPHRNGNDSVNHTPKRSKTEAGYNVTNVEGDLGAEEDFDTDGLATEIDDAEEHAGIEFGDDTEYHADIEHYQAGDQSSDVPEDDVDDNEDEFMEDLSDEDEDSNASDEDEEMDVSEEESELSSENVFEAQTASPGQFSQLLHQQRVSGGVHSDGSNSNMESATRNHSNCDAERTVGSNSDAEAQAAAMAIQLAMQEDRNMVSSGGASTISNFTPINGLGGAEMHQNRRISGNQLTTTMPDPRASQAREQQRQGEQQGQTAGLAHTTRASQLPQQQTTGVSPAIPERPQQKPANAPTANAKHAQKQQQQPRRSLSSYNTSTPSPPHSYNLPPTPHESALLDRIAALEAVNAALQTQNARNAHWATCFEQMEQQLDMAHARERRARNRNRALIKARQELVQELAEEGAAKVELRREKRVVEGQRDRLAERCEGLERRCEEWTYECSKLKGEEEMSERGE